MRQKHIYKIQKKPNDYGLKYSNQKKKHNEKSEWINNMTRELEVLEEGPKVEIHINLLKAIIKIYQTRKRQAMMDFIISCFRNSPPFTRDKL